jgi:hypothetical protein
MSDCLGTLPDKQFGKLKKKKKKKKKKQSEVFTRRTALSLC